MVMDRKWSIDEEIRLFSLICDFKPIGKNEDENTREILSRLNEEFGANDSITREQLQSKLNQHYNLEKLREIENGTDETSDQDSASDEKTKNNIKEETPDALVAKEVNEQAPARNTRSREREAQASKKDQANAKNGPDVKGVKSQKAEAIKENDSGVYLSELSDVEGEMPEDEDILKMKTNLKTQKKAPTKKEDTEPRTRKRTRSNAKAAEREQPPPKRRLRPGTPPVKRRTRSDKEDSSGPQPAQLEEPPAEEPKTRRSARTAVRRSSRKKQT